MLNTQALSQYNANCKGPLNKDQKELLDHVVSFEVHHISSITSFITKESLPTSKSVKSQNIYFTEKNKMATHGGQVDMPCSFPSPSLSYVEISEFY